MKRYYLLAVEIMLLIVFYGCATKSDEYLEFFPDNSSSFAITFKYPSSFGWSLTERSLGIPVWSYNTYGNTEYPYGSIGVTVTVFETEKDAEAKVNHNTLGYIDYVSQIDPLYVSEEILIDGYQAQRFIAEYPPDKSNNEKEPIIVEQIFLVVDNRYYWFLLRVAKSHHSGELKRGFDHIVETVEILDER
jgi:hypothetical protein